MENNLAKLSHFKAYKKNPEPHSESNLKGQIYELFCYNEIIKEYKKINIIRSNCMPKKNYGSFSYNKFGKINYHSNGIHLAEFDILGIQNNIIYFFEITKSEQGKKILKNEIERKIELLKKIFPQYSIVFTLILPRNIIGYENYNIKIIGEPDYKKYLNNEYFSLDMSIIKCNTLEYFCKFETNYNYIDDIINLSKKYFVSNNKNIVHKQHLIERIYDVNHITENTFRYYSVEKQKYGIIEIKNNKMFQDGHIIESRKKCHSEIRIIRDIYKAN